MSTLPAQAGGRRIAANAASLATASLWRIGVAFVLQVLVARRFQAAALGDYAVTLAWLHVGQVLTEAGLPALFVREVAGRPERRLAWLRHVRSLQVALGALIWGVMVALAALIPAMQPRLIMVAAAGASLPFYGVYSAGLAFFDAGERMERSLLLDVLPNALLLAATTAVILAGGSLAAAVAMIAVAQATSALLAGWLIRRSGLLAPPQEAEPLRAAHTLRRASPFFGLSLTDVFQQRADLLILSALASPQVTGLYAAASSLVRVLIKVVQSYGRALFPTFSRLRDSSPDRFAAIARLALRYAAIVTLAAAAIGAPLAAPVLALIYGGSYAAAAPVLAILLFSAPLYAVELLGIQALLAERRQRAALRIALLHTLLLLVLLPPLAAAAGAQGAAWAVVAAGTVAALVAYALAPTAIRLAPAQWLGLALGAASAGALAWLLGVSPRLGPPLPWWAALGAALLGYVPLLRATGVITAQDRERLRSMLRPRRR